LVNVVEVQARGQFRAFVGLGLFLSAPLWQPPASGREDSGEEYLIAVLLDRGGCGCSCREGRGGRRSRAGRVEDAAAGAEKEAATGREDAAAGREYAAAAEEDAEGGEESAALAVEGALRLGGDDGAAPEGAALSEVGTRRRGRCVGRRHRGEEARTTRREQIKKLLLYHLDLCN
jgi:hypothetical protein